MELSDGFLNFEKKTNETHTARTSLLIPKKTLIKVKLNKKNNNIKIN